ncbi:hypothetical protein [Staphylococcus pseudoxylosus]|uniref:hypothetical protein n=1 Tax=Staphylococcus pseudoxylosus TaxID=2282419 RepID=UPI002DBFA02D|nr:hypothetical protein [Staphylococcus pseudoxylosus]MEB7754293.1 hypothetical protein [Staphylococcus pseudoxylosus]
MLTKEFAQRVELSEKQVRKIVQHLEERGYQLSKTEYRGREATDFQEEDIELFQDIAEKVKQTNSYDLAFEELEKEKDFLQVLVKDDSSHLPTDQNVSKLVDDLRSEIQKMRDERHMLGQMINQVHQQQQELHEMQNQITSKLDANTESLQAIQSSTNEIKSTQNAIQDSQKEQSELAKSNVETAHIAASQSTNAQKDDTLTETSTESVETKSSTESQTEANKEVNDKVKNESSDNVASDSKPDDTIAKAHTDESEITPVSEQSTSDASTGKVGQPNSTEAKSADQVTDATTATDEENELSTSATDDTTIKDEITETSTQDATTTNTTSYTSTSSEEAPKEERKGFFARLFNL